jgi:hypothetical protein
LNDSWIPQHITIGLFEVHEAIGFSVASQLCFYIEKYDLMHPMITFVKNESSNLTFMVIAFCSVVHHNNTSWVL